MERICGKPRRGRRRWTAEREARALAVLAETGNASAAAEAIGFTWKQLNARRRKHPAFGAACEAAVVAADERLRDADSPFEGHDDGFQVIRRTSNGRHQIAAVRKDGWTARIEAAFFARLRETGNISASARALGFDPSSVWERYEKWPAFARRWEKVLEEASLAIEFMLACQGNNLIAKPEEAGGGTEAAGDCAPSAAAAPFDPEMALKFLKWREEKKAGRGRRGPARPAMGFDEAKEKILRQIEAIERHEKKYGEGRDGGTQGDGGTGAG